MTKPVRGKYVERYHKGVAIRVTMPCGHEAAWFLNPETGDYETLERCIYSWLHPKDPLYCERKEP